MAQQHRIAERYTNDEVDRLHRHMRSVDRHVTVVKEAAATRAVTPRPTVTIPGWTPSTPGPAVEKYMRYWHLVYHFPSTWSTPRCYVLGSFSSDYKILSVIIEVTEPYSHRGAAQLWTGRRRMRDNYIAKWRLPDADHGAQSFEPQLREQFGHVLCPTAGSPHVLTLWLWRWTAQGYVGLPHSSLHVPGKMLVLVNYLETLACPVEYEPTVLPPQEA